jgi:hypothetical protein
MSTRAGSGSEYKAQSHAPKTWRVWSLERRRGGGGEGKGGRQENLFSGSGAQSATAGAVVMRAATTDQGARKGLRKRHRRAHHGRSRATARLLALVLVIFYLSIKGG